MPIYVTLRKRCSSNSEAFAPELLKNLEEIYPLYYIRSNMFSNLLSHTNANPSEYIGNLEEMFHRILID